MYYDAIFNAGRLCRHFLQHFDSGHASAGHFLQHFLQVDFVAILTQAMLVHFHMFFVSWRILTEKDSL